MLKKIGYILGIFALFAYIIKSFFINQILATTFYFVNPYDIQSIDFEAITNDLTLIDVREKAEYNVAHLPNALPYYALIDENYFDYLPKSDSIVLYCSIGYRSGQLAETLKANGFTNVFNLTGGIFYAKNNKHTLINKQKQITDSIHTFNYFWGFLVNNGTKIH